MYRVATKVKALPATGAFCLPADVVQAQLTSTRMTGDQLWADLLEQLKQLASDLAIAVTLTSNWVQHV